MKFEPLAVDGPNSRHSAPPIRLAGSALANHRHICAFFNSRDDEYRTLLPFIKDGVDAGDKAVRLMASILALPAMWAGRDSSDVTTTLLEVMVRLLQLDFAYVCLEEGRDRSRCEWVRSRDGSAAIRLSADAPYCVPGR